MPRDSNGNYTLPLPDVVGGDVIDAGDFNTTMDDLATAVQDSLSRSGKGGMQVAFEFADGTVGAPAITWTNETSAGFYRISAGEFGYSVGGSKVLNINASGIDGVIGATTPAAGSFTSISFDDVGSNWTNAGRTIADLGAVTTADINGGTLDGVAIGATTPAAATVTTFTSNGIDDNATSTQLTITDTAATFGDDVNATGFWTGGGTLLGDQVGRLETSGTVDFNNSNHTGETLFLRTLSSAGLNAINGVLAFGKNDSSNRRTGSCIVGIQTDTDVDKNGLAGYVSTSSSSSQTLQRAFLVDDTKTFTHDGAVDASAGITVSDGFLSVDTHTNKTVASGAITATKSFHKLGGEGGVADDLDTINGGSDGDILVLMTLSSSVNITAKDGTGNLRLAGGDFIMTTSQDTLVLIYSSGAWFELSRSDNA